ncbi:hypothetical protein K9L27_02575 [Candidatus Gracilibacteria bacterium]|nr:hypothetical protein [Candidatus Gracilibacteria bacterium]
MLQKLNKIMNTGLKILNLPEKNHLILIQSLGARVFQDQFYLFRVEILNGSPREVPEILRGIVNLFSQKNFFYELRGNMRIHSKGKMILNFIVKDFEKRSISPEKNLQQFLEFVEDRLYCEKSRVN